VPAIVLAIAVALLACCGGSGRASEASVLHLRCTNPASGANWPLLIDLIGRRADKLPATVTEGRVSWHDPDQGFFDLDRATGALQLRNASSTGGYFLHYTCKPE